MPEEKEIRFLTRHKIAQWTGASLPTVDRWIHDPDPETRLPSYRPGGSVKIVIREDEFLEWLDRHRTTGPIAIRATRRRKAAHTA